MDDQPTRSKEELELENQKLLEEDEKRQNDPTYVKDPNDDDGSEEKPQEVVATEEKTEKTSEEPKEEEKVEEDKEEKQTPPDEEKKDDKGKEGIDYQKRYADSSREAQKLYKDNLEIAKAHEEANKLIVSDDEIKAEYPEWDEMTDTEKKFARNDVLHKKRWEVVEQAQTRLRSEAEWQGKIDSFVDDPQTLIDNPELEGKEQAFKAFAADKKLVTPGTDFKLVIGAFLYQESKKEKPNNKGQMFETGSGGPNDKGKPKTAKLTNAEAEVLKQTDYKRYREYLGKGLIAIDEV